MAQRRLFRKPTSMVSESAVSLCCRLKKLNIIFTALMFSFADLKKLSGFTLCSNSKNKLDNNAKKLLWAEKSLSLVYFWLTLFHVLSRWHNKNLLPSRSKSTKYRLGLVVPGKPQAQASIRISMRKDDHHLRNVLQAGGLGPLVTMLVQRVAFGITFV